MYISVFRWDQGRWEIIFRMWKQKPLPVIAGKKTVCKAVNRGVVRSSKKMFSRCFAWSRMHKLSYLRNFDWSWSFQRCFNVGYVPFERSPEAANQLRSRRQSVMCDRVNVNKPKLQNFDRLLGLPGHLQWSFWFQQRVISEIRRCGCVATAAVISRGTTVAIAQT